MSVEDIFQKILAHLQTGICFHKELMKAYAFLCLNGYQKQQQHQYLEETNNYLNLFNYYIEHYDKLIKENPPTPLNPIPELWYKHIREAADMNTKRTAIKEFSEKWIKWEQDTISLLSSFYKELEALGEIASAIMISEIIHNTDKELCFAKTQYLLLESTNYDMSFIIEQQNKIDI